MRVSILGSELSRARRTSTGEKRLKTSSLDSGSSQNCGQSVELTHKNAGHSPLSSRDPKLVWHLALIA